MVSFMTRYWNELVTFKSNIEGAIRLKKEKDLLKLFDDYFRASSVPEMQEAYKKRIIAFERNLGIDMHFVVLTPGYTFKAIVGLEKYFINVCTTEFVTRATTETRNGKVEWDIPVYVTKMRDGKDYSKRRCNIVDAVIHPDTMRLADGERRFRKRVECEITSIMKEKLNADLTTVEWKYPKMKHKGKLPTLIIINSEEHRKYMYASKRIATVDEYYEELRKKTEFNSLPAID